MNSPCRYAGCTVEETGKCALENEPSSCPQRLSADATTAIDETAEPSSKAVGMGAPVLRPPESTLSFPPSSTLGLEAIDKLMATRYLTVVAILGEPASGKTAALVSLYLLLANAKLKGWTFADSKSLMGFEDISRGAREWNHGELPDEMTVRTEITDDRRPGFLHIRMRRHSDGRLVDFALSDLPGEWTNDLVKFSNTKRFQFIKSAEVIWIAVNGKSFADNETRQSSILRLSQLAGRLKSIFDNGVPRVILVVTHKDSSEIAATTLERVSAEFTKHGIDLTTVSIASFAAKGSGHRAGAGLGDLVDITTQSQALRRTFWPTSAPRAGGRSYLAYRRDQ